MRGFVFSFLVFNTLVLFCCPWLQAQKMRLKQEAEKLGVRIEAHFLSDTLEIARPIGLSVRVVYPKDWDIVGLAFADSIQGFDYHSHQFFPTRQADSWLIDSALYWVKTFEIDSIQHLSFPIKFFSANDTTVLYASVQSLPLRTFVDSVDLSLLQANLDWQELDMPFDYTYWNIVLLVSFFVLLLLSLLLFNKLLYYYQLFRLKRKYQLFLRKVAQIDNQEFVKKRACFFDFTTQLLPIAPEAFTAAELSKIYEIQGLKELLEKIEYQLYAPQGRFAFETQEWKPLYLFIEKAYDERVLKIKKSERKLLAFRIKKLNYA